MSSSSSDVALHPQRPYLLLETGSPGRPSPLSHSSLILISEMSACSSSNGTLCTQRSSGILGTGSPGRPHQLSQLLSSEVSFSSSLNVALLSQRPY